MSINFTKNILICIFSTLQIVAFGQTERDSLKARNLREITILGQRFDISSLPAIRGTYIYSGKKSEVLDIDNINANVAEKTARQIFAKIPGVFVYDMDGSGNQINISTRGLDPHRGWEFNQRVNGVIINSDMYGYPASHYSLPMESVQRIELVRGTASLQYGAQFGGMYNIVTKRGDTTRPISFETINSVGSYGLVSSYDAIGGKIGKWEYYAYYSTRKSDGYRKNSRSNYDGQDFIIKYNANRDLVFKAELARSNYNYQIPGPLTDSMFNADPRQATRSRNYFSPEIYVPSFSAEWQLTSTTRVSWLTSAVLGVRNSIQFDKPANIVDVIDPTTLTYANRQVDADHFNSYNSELRLLHEYTLGKIKSQIAGGLQVMDNDLYRQQLGKGTTGSDYDLTITGDFGRDLNYKTQNIAAFVENKFDLTSKFSINAGARFESGESKMSGSISYLDATQIPNIIKHQFPLFGLSMNYKINETQNLYAGFSQAYRPVIFKDIIPISAYERTDKNLKDAYGYNLEIGYKGSTEHFHWDVTAFRLRYNNRLGSLSIVDNGVFYLYRTNIGDAVTQGIEAFGEYSTPITEGVRLNFFTSTAYFDAHYENAQVKVGNVNQSVTGNHLESVPAWISRNGLTFKGRKWSISTLVSYTSETFADALNTVQPSANGSVGLVPAYTLLDINATFRLLKNISLRLNVNNVTDKQYFTKRPTFYPGPGIWPSDGRSVSATVGFKF